MSATRPQLPQEFIAAHKRRRMIDAMSELCAEQGYEATKIADVVRRAHVARKTLYDNFSGKEELFLAAFDTPWPRPKRRSPRPATRSRRATGRRAPKPACAPLLEFIAAHPAEARLCLVEAPAAAPNRPPATRRRSRASSSRLREAAPPGSGRPDDAGGGAGRRHRLDRPAGGPPRTPPMRPRDLLPELAEFVISPYRDVGKR